ncbi:MAG: hypothetical protein KKB31_05705 [Nanoarchaeota archaeon]|nr:hypothetical protein [Nanoarchaeota archaeon]
MKKILIIMGAILLLALPFTLALEQEGIATASDIKEAGTTPEDGFIYELDLFVERITELFNDNLKLVHARERLAEMKVMIHKNKLQEAERVNTEFIKLKLRIRNRMQVEEHAQLMNNLGQKISAVASVKGQLTDTQKVEIKELIQEHKVRIQAESENIITEAFPKFKYACGDFNNDGLANMIDWNYLNEYLYQNGPAPSPLWIADMNGDGEVELGDLVYFNNYLNKEGPSLKCRASQAQLNAQN